jgi:hypothetical protein
MDRAAVNHLPNILTVQQVLSSRRGCQGLMYRGCQIHYLDWHPAPVGSHYAVIIQPNNEPVEIWLAPETWLEEQFNVQPAYAQR